MEETFVTFSSFNQFINVERDRERRRRKRKRRKKIK
jgi:hypothetical protein